VRLATYRSGDEEERLGVLVDERVLDVRAAAESMLGEAPSWSASMLEFLRAGPAGRREAEELLAKSTGANAAMHNVGEVELLAPVPRPESVRDAMSFERHLLQATRVAGLGPSARVDAPVNGAEWSRGNTGEAYWRFEQLIEHISRDETLYPGDFIGSGTCSGAQGMGCGLEQGRFLSPGDVVELEVQGIGVLRNRVAGV
jgi:Fumarylacetoacetate (FAA) hydrolase family